jgi:hypothetical protein
VGYYLKDGKRTPKVFWLGHDQAYADYLAFTYRKAWAALRWSGAEHWTPEALANVRAFVDHGRLLLLNRVRDRQEELGAIQKQLGTLHQIGLFRLPPQDRVADSVGITATIGSETIGSPLGPAPDRAAETGSAKVKPAMLYEAIAEFVSCLNGTGALRGPQGPRPPCAGNESEEGAGRLPAGRGRLPVDRPPL